jgi:FkbM family methyltransferase
MKLKYDPQLIYDVGMNNGDDTAYYLRRGFRVLAIEANPDLVANSARRFAGEIATRRLMILNVGIAAEEGVLSFWICETNSRLSSFDRRLASLDGSWPHHEIRVPCRRFRSLLEEFGVPFYVKVDIQGNDFLCVEDLDPHQLPKFISVSEVSLLASLRKRGFNYFKCISQAHFLPLQLPPVIETGRVQRAEWLRQNRNPLIRVFRKLGGRHWIERQLNRIRTRDGWLFPEGSSGPFGDELLGRWLSYDELGKTLGEFLRLRRESPRSLLWAPEGIFAVKSVCGSRSVEWSNPFWVDLHARRD